MKEKINSGFNLDNAVQLATAAHEGQFNKKSKEDYILHPLRVMSRLLGEETKMVGILHDVVEDTDITIADLIKLGLPKKVIEAITLLTHPENYKGTYDEYFENIENIAKSDNQYAIDSKFSDLIDNSDITRIDSPTENDFKRVQKYQKAMEILRPLVSSNLLQH